MISTIYIVTYSYIVLKFPFSLAEKSLEIERREAVKLAIYLQYGKDLDKKWIKIQKN
jgi:hypothetical protein